MDLLDVPVPKTSRSKTMTTDKAHALTSAGCLKALQEKESKKEKKLKKKSSGSKRDGLKNN